MENKDDAIHEKRHYETLVKLFNRFMYGISTITAVAALVIGANVYSIKEEMRADLKDLKEQVKDLENKANASSQSVREEANRQISLIRSDAAELIGFTKEVTETQVDIIKEDVKNLALSTARTRVEESFQSENINSLVENKAEKVIGRRLDNLVEQELEKVKTVFEYIPIVTTAYDRVYHGDRKYFNLLDSLSHFHENEIVNEIARELLLQKGNDYEEAIYDVYPAYGLSRTVRTDVNLYEEMKIDSNFVKNSTPVLRVRAMLDTIQNSEDLYNVAAAFLIINQELSLEIKPFDMQIFRDLKKKYKVE